MGLINTLQGIGDAIREKAGTNERIPLKNMAEVILNLSGGANCKSAVYNEDDTITLIDNNDKEHIIKCVYGDNGLESVTYDGEIIEIAYDEGALIRVADTQIDVSKVPITNSAPECVEYDSVIYNDDNTVTLTEPDGTVHTMTLNYNDENRITGVMYDDEAIEVEFVDGKLENIDGMEVDLSNIPTTSDGAELNIAYGETAPIDTSMLWVKTNTPNKTVFSTDIEGAESIKTLETVLPKGLNDIGCARVGNKIYLFGGGLPSNPYRVNSIYVFDVETEKITTLATTLPVAMYGMSCAVVGKKIYLIGGYASDPVNTIYIFDTETEMITTSSATVNSHRLNAGCIVIGTKIYLFGSNFYLGGSHYNNTISIFDTETEIVTPLSVTLPIAGGYPSCIRVGDNVYLFGGTKYGGTYYHNNICVFNIESQTIRTLTTKLPIECARMDGVLIGNKIYLFGGRGNNSGTETNIDSILMFDIETEALTTLETALPAANSTMCCENVGIFVYLFGGNYSTVINKFNLSRSLEVGKVEIETDLFINKFNIINTSAVTLELGVKNVYIGNENNEAERAEAYLYKDDAWVQI